MPKVRSLQYTVINDLESLSTEVDERATMFLPPSNLIAEYCNLFKEAASKIRDCSDLKEVVHPPSIETFLESSKKEVPDTRDCSDLKEVVHPPPIETFLESSKKEVPDTSIPKAETDRDQSHRVSPQNHAEGKQNDTDNMLRKVESLGKKCKGSYTVVAENLPIAKGSQKIAETPKGKEGKGSYTVVGKSQPKAKGSQKDDNSQSIAETPKGKGKGSYTVVGKSQPKAKGSQNIPKVDSVKIMAEVQKTEENNKRSCRVIAENQLKSEIRKTEENNKRSYKVLVENQLKAKAGQKKNEKLVTQMQKRLLSEKEKQRLEKEKELLKKKVDLQKCKISKENASRPPMTIRPKETNEGKRTLQEINDIKKTKEEENECKRAKIANELKEQYVLKNSVTSVKVKQNGSCANIVAKTPDKKTPSHKSSDTYELTPVPDSSTYDFSDDEDKPPPGKYVPSWASGAQLKSNLLHQYYNPVDPDVLFGRCLNETPNLTEMFNIRKKEYMKRTSSAVWDHPPLHPED